NHRVTGQHTVLEGVFHALVNRTNVIPGHHAADNLVDKLVAAAFAQRLKADIDLTILAAAGGLAHKLAFSLDSLANGFAIGHLRLAHVGLNLELALYTFNADVKVQLAPPGNYQLSQLTV